MTGRGSHSTVGQSAARTPRPSSSHGQRTSAARRPGLVRQPHPLLCPLRAHLPQTLTQPHHLPPGVSPEQGPPGTLWNRSSGVHPGTVTYTPPWTRVGPPSQPEPPLGPRTPRCGPWAAGNPRGGQEKPGSWCPAAPSPLGPTQHTQGPARAQPGLSLRLRCPATSLGSGAAAGRPEAAASLQGFREGAGAAGRFTSRSEARPRHPVTACRPSPPGRTLGQAPPRERGAHCARPRGRGRAGSFNYRWLGPLSRANPGPRLRAARAGAPSPPARARGPRVLTSCRPQLKRARRGCRCANELRGRWAARQGGAGAGWGRGWLGWGDLGPFPGRGPGLPECAHLRRGVPASPTQKSGRPQCGAGTGVGGPGEGPTGAVLGPVVCPGRPPHLCCPSPTPGPGRKMSELPVLAPGWGLQPRGAWMPGHPHLSFAHEERPEAWGLEQGAKGARALTLQALSPGGSWRRRGAARQQDPETLRETP